MSATLGNKKNPYNYSTYTTRLQDGLWHGGWVVCNDGKLYYIDGNNQLHLGRTFGSHNSPISEGLYSEMNGLSIWCGGYTYNGLDLVYITQSNVSYYETDNIFGHRDTPCPYDVFVDMCDNGMWSSGWIEYTDGFTQYVQNYEASTSGSGSGSSGSNNSSSSSSSGSGSGYGCGCGCESSSSSSNSETGDFDESIVVSSDSQYYATIEGGNISILICWTAGKPFSQPASIPYIQIMSDPSKYTIYNKSFNVCWIEESGNLYLSIEGHFSYNISISNNETETCYWEIGQQNVAKKTEC